MSTPRTVIIPATLAECECCAQRCAYATLLCERAERDARTATSWSNIADAASLLGKARVVLKEQARTHRSDLDPVEFAEHERLREAYGAASRALDAAADRLEEKMP